MNLRHVTQALALATAAALAATVTACGGSGGGSDDVTYAPAAYGQQVGGVYDCFYADDPGEATALIAAGLCPRGSVPTVMPLHWEEEYWGYYSSPAYYNTYMPVRYRSHYTSVTVVTFSRTYKTQIAAASSKAVYKSSTGQRVTGTSKLKFGSSGTSQSVHGGGTRGGCAQSMTVVQLRSGSSGSSSSHGGGTRSGGSSGSTSGSGSRGGC